MLRLAMIPKWLIILVFLFCFQCNADGHNWQLPVYRNDSFNNSVYSAESIALKFEGPRTNGIVNINDPLVVARAHKYLQSENYLPDNGKIFSYSNGISVFETFPGKVAIDNYNRRDKRVPKAHEPFEETHFVQIIQGGCHRDAVFFDVGTHWGYYCILAKKICPEITIIVVNPKFVHRMEMVEAMVHNKINDSFLEYPYAIGKIGQDGDVIDMGYSEVDVGDPGKDEAITISFPTLIKDVFSYLPESSHVLLMMVDIQGWETELFKQWVESKFIFQKRIKNVVVGVHGFKVEKIIKATLASPIVKENYRINLFQMRVKPYQPDGVLLMTQVTADNMPSTRITADNKRQRSRITARAKNPL